VVFSIRRTALALVSGPAAETGSRKQQDIRSKRMAQSFFMAETSPNVLVEDMHGGEKV
jgi:hypothetical protein